LTHSPTGRPVELPGEMVARIGQWRSTALLALM